MFRQAARCLLLLSSFSLGVLTSVAWVAPPNAQASENAFLKLGSIKGNATTTGYKDQIVFQSMSFSLSDTKQWDATITGTGSITLVKYQDISSLQLAQAASQRLLFPLATFAVAKKKKSAEQQEYLKWTLENVFVSSIMVRPSLDNRTPPVEFITLTFQKGIWQEGTPRITSSYFPPLTP